MTARARTEHTEHDATTKRQSSALHHHPQGTRAEVHHHPQGLASDDSRHPQARSVDTPAAGGDAALPTELQRGASHNERDPVRGEAARPSGEHVVAVPPPGALRPLARALLSAAMEVHAARCDPLGAGSPRFAEGLRMGECEGRLTGRLPGRLCRHCGATPEARGSGDAKTHVNAPPPLPLIDSDCMGRCS